MGEVVVDIALENFLDRILMLENKLTAEKVRKHQMSALVDTGAVMLSLPQDIIEKLGLNQVRKVIVTYADERREERDVFAAGNEKIGDRPLVTEAISGPPLSEALIGQVILEELDMLVDCQNQTLLPRPESPVYPSLKMK
ncbi:MAG: clan AA aspartic protease [Candidatus Parabeggiatoa sp. nov. 3]|nr:MAG: clan AA aspartic protease [Gammaproteobacteria bacterium]RKZ58391.1 MAG: clan AA aspartic protease [Gammaproteobacteria bacterium]RKZ79811.1 MAG: clan AA aspartic protease [Gammaproteobacteria bacterium]